MLLSKNFLIEIFIRSEMPGLPDFLFILLIFSLLCFLFFYIKNKSKKTVKENFYKKSVIIRKYLICQEV